MTALSRPQDQCYGGRRFKIVQHNDNSKKVVLTLSGTLHMDMLILSKGLGSKLE